MAFYKEHLLDPYGKAVTGLRTGRITIAKNYKALKKELGIVPRTLKKNFKYEDENGNMKESLVYQRRCYQSVYLGCAGT